MPRLLQHSKALFLVGLLALTLLGTQAVKDAPWHDHSQHVADCALCHLQFTGEALPSSSPAPLAGAGEAPLHAAVPVFALFFLFTHYQGRAPPRFLAFR